MTEASSSKGGAQRRHAAKDAKPTKNLSVLAAGHNCSDDCPLGSASNAPGPKPTLLTDVAKVRTEPITTMMRFAEFTRAAKDAMERPAAQTGHPSRPQAPHRSGAEPAICMLRSTAERPKHSNSRFKFSMGA